MYAANSKRYFVAVGIPSADGAQIAIRRRYFLGGVGLVVRAHTQKKTDDGSIYVARTISTTHTK